MHYFHLDMNADNMENEVRVFPSSISRDNSVSKTSIIFCFCFGYLLFVSEPKIMDFQPFTIELKGEDMF
jgi:hypothetical protein